VQDAQTDLARQLGTRFGGGPGVDRRATLIADRPHVLLYPELGMDPLSARLAGERLAPVQCVSWGQPETSGLPTMDFFLSSALMEPEEAASHYSEQLVTLPNLGIHYTSDERHAELTSRSALGLRDGAVIFWCGQALYKYLPQYDSVFARIATAVDDCLFLFIGFAKSPAVTNCSRARLRQTFAEHGLDADRHCVFLPPMSQERFLGTIELSDIMLDSVGWSGGKSTLDALALAPVIVTHAGELMRGRHTMAILTRIGVTETIARTVDEYVGISVQLALNPVRRSALRARMAAGVHRVMSDAAPIRALETFLIRVVAQHRVT
jgi:protein O-GlcNAc transferase